MTDILIRDVPDDVLASIDVTATRLGMSRTEYLRRQMIALARRTNEPLTPESWNRFAEKTQDLRDPEVMKGAWEHGSRHG